jgi:hypothetical protein
MAAMSNAERQRRWVQRLKERAAAGNAGVTNGGKPSGVTNEKLIAKLDPLIAGLFEEGVKGMATMSPGTVMRHVTLLERALVEHGIMPESKRSEDPQGYVRSLRAKVKASVSNVTNGAEAEIPLSALSMTAQEKMKAWQRQTEKKLREQIEQEERAKVRAAWNDSMLPSFNKRLADAERVVKARKGVFPRSFYRKLLACVHPDRSNSPDAQEVFSALKDAEVLLCREAETPTSSFGMPKTVEELLARKRQARNGTRG